MNIDFHTHVKVAKKSDFSPDYFKEMIHEAKLAGLDAIALTEHFNTSSLETVYQYLDDHFDYVQDYYDADGLKIFPGMEVDVREVSHILLISRRENVAAMFRTLKNHLGKEDFLPFSALMDLAEQYNVLKIGAHPFRPATPLTQHAPEQLKRLDALDLNGKDLYSIGVDENRSKVYGFAERLGLPVTGGSDTHQFMQYGTVINTLPENCATIDDLKAAVHSGNFSIRISDDLKLRVKSATLIKKLVKQLLEKGKAVHVNS
ncbi:PHP domain-containing protein [Sporolactobacillus sp. CPB3-1]|uniref:PHP domain-containing protein n=1 Tax=Sporolactobacillus mangiferae TaxID=2940498 RepID=A0ABT0MBT4_9BACL|nr:PHP domain-containing protein [Sporolactobacillus mangiferae]MCL1632334.1 PHP domain-containing protein [Sporolactobacillus mangiferae]